MKQATHLMPIWTCYQCDNRNAIKCVCLLTTRKRNRHPGPLDGIPKWCPLPRVYNSTIKRAPGARGEGRHGQG